jgi:hypothetical protein
MRSPVSAARGGGRGDLPGSRGALAKGAHHLAAGRASDRGQPPPARCVGKSARAIGIGGHAEGTALSIWRLPCMSLRADIYRQKAAEAKQSAAKATSPSIKRAFEEVAGGWLVLAEQVEWIDRQRFSVRHEEN